MTTTAAATPTPPATSSWPTDWQPSASVILVNWPASESQVRARAECTPWHAPIRANWPGNLVMKINQNSSDLTGLQNIQSAQHSSLGRGISQLSCGAFSHTPNRILAACCCWCCCLGMATQKLRHFINCALFAAKKKGQPLTCCALLCDSPWQLTETLAHQHRPRPTATSHCHCRTAHQQHHHLVAVGHQGGFIWLPKTKREILLQSPQSPHLQVAGFFLGSVLGATPQCCEHHFASYLCSLDLKKI